MESKAISRGDQLMARKKRKEAEQAEKARKKALKEAKKPRHTAAKSKPSGKGAGANWEPEVETGETATARACHDEDELSGVAEDPEVVASKPTGKPKAKGKPKAAAKVKAKAKCKGKKGKGKGKKAKAARDSEDQQHEEEDENQATDEENEHEGMDGEDEEQDTLPAPTTRIRSKKSGKPKVESPAMTTKKILERAIKQRKAEKAKSPEEKEEEAFPLWQHFCAPCKGYKLVLKCQAACV